jgi:hypothetical protein
VAVGENVVKPSEVEALELGEEKDPEPESERAVPDRYLLQRVSQADKTVLKRLE